MNDIPDRIHQTLMRTVVKGLADTSMVLKGGTALLLVYSLDRHSVDIDYDSPAKLDLPSRLDGIMRSTRMEYKIVDRKHTDTTSRVFIHYRTGRVKDGRLKIETKNNRVINPSHVHNNPGFLVYTIDKLCEHKLDAINTRTKGRDLYDLAHIAKHYSSELSADNVTNLKALARDRTLRNRFYEDWHNENTTKDKSIDRALTALETILTQGQQDENADKSNLDIEPGV